jgi:hypothetical protein
MEIGSVRTVAGHAAASRGVPPSLARQAEHACIRRFAGALSEPLDDRARRRIGAYFDAVVRRGAFRSTSPDMLALRRRLVAASIEEDLHEAIRRSQVRGAPMMTLPLPLGV